MENITRMKNALQEFRTESIKAANEIVFNNKTYQTDAAETANAIVRERLAGKKAAALAEIEAAYSAGKTKAQEWARMDGGKVTEDVKLLEFSMTPAQYTALAEKHRNNGVMIHMLEQYGKDQNEKNGANLFNHPGKILPVGSLPSLEKKLNTYDKFHNYASRLVSSIEDDPGRMSLTSELEAFGVYVPGNSPLLEEIR